MTLILLLTGLAVGVVVLNYYLESSREKLLATLMDTSGLDISFREMDVRAWRSFPQITFALDSLVVRDSLRPAPEPALFAVDRLTGTLSLAALLRDSIRLEEVTLRGGGIYIERDSSGNFNAGSLFAPRVEEGALPDPQDLLPTLDWDEVRLSIHDFAARYRNFPRDKRMAAHFDAIGVTVSRNPAGAPRIVGSFAGHVEEIAFNLDAGGYLTDTPVSGPVDVTFGPERWIVPATELRVGTQQFTAAATIERDTTLLSHIYLTNETTDYDATYALLTRKLRDKMSDYYIGGTFPVQAHISSTFYRDKNPRVAVEFSLTGQAARAKQYDFSAAWFRASFVNRLATRAGGTPGSRKNLRIALDSTRLRLGTLRFSAPWAIVTANEYDTRLETPLAVTGPARAISDRLLARDFFLERGHFDLQSYVNASLLSFEDIVTTSDARLRLTDVDVYYRPAGARFPFAYIHLRKDDQDIRVQLQSEPLASGFAFALEGRVDNLAPLLIDLPGETIHTDVSLHAPYFDWTDFLAFFGQAGYFGTEEDPDRDRGVVASMKQTLLGLENTFHPRVRARFDTVAYYDVFTLRDLRTGLHFNADSLVLEETKFDWRESDVTLSTRLHLGGGGETDFTLDARTEHLDLNRLRGTLEYFGVDFPTGLDSLPTDLRIDFAHRGTIVDTTGIRPGTNSGTLVFDDGRHGLFTGEMQYAPGPEGLHTRIRLAGDPLIVNQLFGAEDFLFGTGRFDLELEVPKTPRDPRELLDIGRLHLRIDDSRIDYRPQGVVIPVRSFVADIAENRADYRLRLRIDSLRQELELSGRLDSLSAFLYPSEGRSFRVRTKARSDRLNWADLRQFVRVPQPDTSSFEWQWLVSATSGLFNTFHPDLDLIIDTLRLDEHAELHDLFGGLSMRDSSLLRLERSGFTFGEGRIRLDATYALDDQPVSPFSLHWQIDSLSLGRLLDEVQHRDLVAALDTGKLSARLDLAGELTGWMNETTQRLVADGAHGEIRYRLDTTALAEWPLLRTIGRKALMRERFQSPTVAPLAGTLPIEDGRIRIPRTEIQSTAAQFFVEGYYDLAKGPDLLITIPLRNIGRGQLLEPPPPTGYAHAGWKVYLVVEVDDNGEAVTRFRLGRRQYYRERDRLDELRDLRQRMREHRRGTQRDERRRKSRRGTIFGG